MYGVPSNLNLAAFQGATLIGISLGEFIIQFRFQDPASNWPGPPGPEIGVEGAWELRDSSGAVLDSSEGASAAGSNSNSNHENLRVNRLLGKEVVETEVDPPRSFALRFDDGQVLRIFDSSEKYESFSIQPGDIFV